MKAVSQFQHWLRGIEGVDRIGYHEKVQSRDIRLCLLNVKETHFLPFLQQAALELLGDLPCVSCA